MIYNKQNIVLTNNTKSMKILIINIINFYNLQSRLNKKLNMLFNKVRSRHKNINQDSSLYKTKYPSLEIVYPKLE
jgi:hypothetical protein